MLESYPSFFVVVAHFMQPATILDDTIPEDKQIQIVTAVSQGLSTFLESGVTCSTFAALNRKKRSGYR